MTPQPSPALDLADRAARILSPLSPSQVYSHHCSDTCFKGSCHCCALLPTIYGTGATAALIPTLGSQVMALTWQDLCWAAPALYLSLHHRLSHCVDPQSPNPRSTGDLNTEAPQAPVILPQVYLCPRIPETWLPCCSDCKCARPGAKMELCSLNFLPWAKQGEEEDPSSLHCWGTQ